MEDGGPTTFLLHPLVTPAAMTWHDRYTEFSLEIRSCELCDVHHIRALPSENGSRTINSDENLEYSCECKQPVQKKRLF